jgi:hypothetical protein
MDKSLRDVQHFVSFATKHLKLRGQPRIRFVGSQEDSKQAFGHAMGKDITVRVTNRHPIDVMRTLAHELTHFRQNAEGSKASEQEKEDNANAIAGRIMRAYDTKYPKAFKDNPIHEEGMAANATGAGVVGTGDNPDPTKPLAKFFKKKLRDVILTRKTLGDIRESK